MVFATSLTCFVSLSRLVDAPADLGSHSLLSKTGQGAAELLWKQRDLRAENENFQIGV
jgi:hypothetical protein